MFHPEDRCPKTGQPVSEVLRSKHPEALPPTARSLEAYGGKPLAMVPVDITDMTVATVPRRLSGSAGTVGVDLIRLQHCLLQFGVASMGIRKIVRKFGDWMATGCPTWASYRALMSGRLIGLKKCPEVRPVGVGGAWLRMLEKCVLVVTGAEVK